jgi:uncharacterized ferritin-like protein (DUF455 family)
MTPKEMPKRRAFGSSAGRVALLHALAHIELNAIDLGWDIIARFSGEPLSRDFFDDWVGVASEEALHFELLAQRLGDFGARYGDLPAHDGLWESAAATTDDLLDRLAVVSLVLEARGLDVTPEMMLRSCSSITPERVASAPSQGRDRSRRRVRWFDRLCRRGLVPDGAFRSASGAASR